MAAISSSEAHAEVGKSANVVNESAQLQQDAEVGSTSRTAGSDGEVAAEDYPVEVVERVYRCVNHSPIVGNTTREIRRLMSNVGKLI